MKKVQVNRCRSNGQGDQPCIMHVWCRSSALIACTPPWTFTYVRRALVGRYLQTAHAVFFCFKILNLTYYVLAASPSRDTTAVLALNSHHSEVDPCRRLRTNGRLCMHACMGARYSRGEKEQRTRQASARGVPRALATTTTTYAHLGVVQLVVSS